MQAKAEQISKAEITIKRQNQEIEKTEQIKETTKSTSGEEITKRKEKQKVKLLEEIADLRKDRTVQLDQFKAAIAALEAKTDENAPTRWPKSAITNFTPRPSAVFKWTSRMRRRPGWPSKPG